MDDGMPPSTNRSFDPSTKPIRTTFDWGTISPSIAVVETVARARDEEPTAVPPLFDRLDPDALDLVFEDWLKGPGKDEIRLSFPFAAHEVTVTSGGEVTVEPLQMAR